MKNKHLYPVDWLDTIRPRILKRDNYKCTNCFVQHRTRGYYDSQNNFITSDHHIEHWAQNNGFKIQVIHLQIAHINHIKDDCRDENLQSLCPRCHLNYDRAFNNILRKLAGRQKQKKF